MVQKSGRIVISIIIYLTWQMSETHFTKRVGAHSIQILWKSFCYIFHSSVSNMLQFCKCHGSSAVMTCAKLWPDLTIVSHVRATHIFTRLNYELITICKMSPMPCIGKAARLVHFFCLGMSSGAIPCDECTHIGRLSSPECCRLKSYTYSFMTLGAVIKFRICFYKSSCSTGTMYV